MAAFVALDALLTEAAGGAETIVTLIKIVILLMFVAFGFAAVNATEFTPCFPPRARSRCCPQWG